MAEPEPEITYVFPIEQPHAVIHPVHGGFVVPQPMERYRADDPLVIAYPWLFTSVADMTRQLESVIEQTTAAPGERRATRRTGKAI